MCHVLKISESGYYRWLRNRNKPTGRQLLSVEIKLILNEHPDNDNYGVNRMVTALAQKGIEVSPARFIEQCRIWEFCTVGERPGA